MTHRKKILKSMIKINNLPKQLKIYKAIRCRIRNPKTFIKSSYHIVDFGDGIRALAGRQNSQNNIKIQTTIFNTNPENGKTWTLKSAKDWIKSHKSTLKRKIFAKDIVDGVSKIKKVKVAPKKFTNKQLMNKVEKLRKHFNCLPRRVEKK